VEGGPDRLLSITMGLAAFLLPGDEGTSVSKKAADAAKAMKQSTDCLAIAAEVTPSKTPHFTEPDPEPITTTVAKHSYHAVQYSALRGALH